MEEEVVEIWTDNTIMLVYTLFCILVNITCSIVLMSSLVDYIHESGINSENLHLPKNCSYLQVIILIITTILMIVIYTLEADFTIETCLYLETKKWLVNQISEEGDSSVLSDEIFNTKSMCLYLTIFIQILSFMVLMVCMMIYLNEQNEIEYQ